MKTLTIQIDDDAMDVLTRLANITGTTPEAFVSGELPDLLADIQTSTAEKLAAKQLWDSLEEAKGVAARADAFDDSAYHWHFYRMPSGLILVETGDHRHVDNLRIGCALMHEGYSADWRKAA